MSLCEAGKIFGGYNPIGWSNQTNYHRRAQRFGSQYLSTIESFIFSFVDTKSMAIINHLSIMIIDCVYCHLAAAVQLKKAYMPYAF